MIPAIALGGALIEGWTGPVSFFDVFPPGRPGRWVETAYGRGGMANGGAPENIRLNPTRPEVQHRIADVLRSLGHEVGHLLPVELGGRVGDAREYREDPENGMGVSLFAVRGARVSARLLAASVEGVEQGRGVVRGVLGEWVDVRGEWVRDAATGEQSLVLPCMGWRVIGADGRALASGPETGPAGRAAADAAALRLGWALLDPTARDGVRVPGEVDG